MRVQLVAAVTISLFAAACSGSPDPIASAPSAPTPTAAASTGPTEAATEEPTDDPTPSPSPEPEEPTLTDAELAALGVNELGRVLVGEWHIIGDTDGEYRTSRDTFRAQLEELYDRGYRPVTQAEFIAGTFPIPAGTAPIVLTFDDSTRGHMDLDDDGQPVADTAVGIIEAFAAEHDDWRATAVFAYNFPGPFGDDSYPAKLRWLVDNGYELSNHSVNHTNLGSISTAEVVANLADNLARLREVLPDVEVPSLTLPFGAHPDDRSVELTGTADGTTYVHELVYLVGAYPTRSPHDAAFDGAAIQRVPAHAVVGTGPEWFYDRLDDLDAPGERFVSDGDPSTITYPDDRADDLGAIDDAFSVRSYPAAS